MEISALEFVRQFEFFVLVVEIFVLIALFRMIGAVNRERKTQIGDLRKEIQSYQRCHDRQHREEVNRMTAEIDILKTHMVEIQTKLEFLQKGYIGRGK